MFDDLGGIFGNCDFTARMALSTYFTNQIQSTTKKTLSGIYKHTVHTHMSHRMRKQSICKGKNKAADQLCSNCSTTLLLKSETTSF